MGVLELAWAALKRGGGDDGWMASRVGKCGMDYENHCLIPSNSSLRREDKLEAGDGLVL